MSISNKSDIKKASTKELLDFYNANSGRDPVTRFTDRATAERRVAFLLDRPTSSDEGKTETAEEPVAAAKPQKVAKGVKLTKAKPTKAARSSKPKAEKPAADPVATHEKRAASISKSWQDDSTRKARSARNGCKVSGEVYSSVPMAFRALKLDMKKCQRVRRDMVVNGHVTHEGHRFTLVRE